MKTQTIKEVVETIDAIYNEKFTAIKIKIWMQALDQYPDEAILEALNRHISDPASGKWPPKPADIVAKMPAKASSVMSADEAWTIAVQSFDEDSSLVWNDHIAEARNSALILWPSDKIGARMAFKAAYDRLQGFADVTPKLTLGADANSREEAVVKAQSLGIISRQRVQELLPTKASKETVQAMKLLTGKPVDAQAGFSRMKTIIEDALKKADAKEAKKEAAREAARLEEKEKRAQDLAKFKAWVEARETQYQGLVDTE